MIHLIVYYTTDDLDNIIKCANGYFMSDALRYINFPSDKLIISAEVNNWENAAVVTKGNGNYYCFKSYIASNQLNALDANRQYYVSYYYIDMTLY